MSVYVFVGPTIGAAEVHAELGGWRKGATEARPEDVVVCGPASFGDVCRTTERGPTAIAVIDGYFERVPAVWHKEILWAMSEGVHVFGSSSMGALRAAELSDFGMVGVGAIYEAFQRGVLEDDDEVAVVHGPAEQGYPALSEAMVNIRATLDAASEAGVIGPATTDALVRLAKARFYGDRSYPAMFVEAGARGLDARELDSFRGWLPRGRVDRKREDALLLLGHLREWLATHPKRKRVTYRLASTDAWLEARRVALAQPSGEADATPGGPSEALLEELRVAGVYAAACDGAVARGASLEKARGGGVQPDAIAVRAAIEEFRRDRALLDRPAFDRWCAEQRLDEREITAFFEDQARLQWARPIDQAVTREHLVGHLRSAGDFGRYMGRADAKARELAALGGAVPSLKDVGMTEPDVWRWYFEERLRRAVPENLEAFSTGAGFGGKEEMRSAVLRELFYARHVRG